MRKFAILVLVSLMIMPGLTVWGNSINELQQERREVQERAAAARGELQTTEREINVLTAEIEEMDAVLDEASETLVVIETALDETLLALEAAEIALEEAQQEWDDHFDRFKTRLRVMHVHGPVGYLEVVLQATSFTDFLTRLDHMNAIARNDREMSDRLQEAEEQVAYKVEETHRQKNRVTSLRNAQEETVRTLEEALEQKYIFLNHLEYDSYQHRAIVRQLEQDDRNIEAQIQRLQEEERRRRQEEERLRREAEQAEREAEAARIRALQQSVRPRSGEEMIWPLPGHRRISSGYGNRTHPISRRAEFHTGIDIPAPSGTVILAAKGGTVIMSGRQGGFGNTVVIYHGDGLSTLYAHNSSNIVTVGMEVEQGDPIARVGSTGVSTGPHLHFEVRQNGRHVDPRPHLGI